MYECVQEGWYIDYRYKTKSRRWRCCLVNIIREIMVSTKLLDAQEQNYALAT